MDNQEFILGLKTVVRLSEIILPQKPFNEYTTEEFFIYGKRAFGVNFAKALIKQTEDFENK